MSLVEPGDALKGFLSIFWLMSLVSVVFYSVYRLEILLVIHAVSLLTCAPLSFAATMVERFGFRPLFSWILALTCLIAGLGFYPRLEILYLLPFMMATIASIVERKPVAAATSAVVAIASFLEGFENVYHLALPAILASLYILVLPEEGVWWFNALLAMFIVFEPVHLLASILVLTAAIIYTVMLGARTEQLPIILALPFILLSPLAGALLAPIAPMLLEGRYNVLQTTLLVTGLALFNAIGLLAICYPLFAYGLALASWFKG